MRRSLLALLVLLPAASTVATGAPAAPPSFPKGQVIYRPECFGYAVEERVTASPPPVAPGGATGAVGTTLDQDFLQKIPAGRSYQSAVQSVPGSAPSPSPAKPSRSKGNKKATAAPAEPMPSDMGWAPMEEQAAVESEASLSAGISADKKAKEDRGPLKEAEPAAAMEAQKNLEDDASAAFDESRLDRSELRREVAQQAPRRVLDWGGTVYLSNDDSMSLASAQRLLYAAMNGLPFSIREVRPHELLNYFSFDNVTPDPDQVFDVLASAEQDGDKLSVALAVKGATPPRQPLDLTLVVDRSCSMMDEGRMDYTKRGLTLMTNQLTRGDRLDVVLFDDRVCVPLENYVVGRDDPQLLTNVIQHMQPEGATDVSLGLRTAYTVAKSHEDTHGRNRRVMIVTDALTNSGESDPHLISEVGRAFEEDGIRLTGVGVGREFNDQVLNLLTEKGKGAYVFLGSEAVVDRVFGASGFNQLVQTIAHDVHFALKLPPSLAMERFYGEEASTVKEEVQPINYYAGTTQLFLQDLVLKNGKVVGSDPVELEITFRDARTGEPSKRLFRTTVGAMVEADPHNVRKGLALMAWTDMLTARAMGADPCGAELQTYASRASKVADDAEIAFVNGLVRRECGDFDLPAFVSNNGVPFKVRVDADIPISTVALTCQGKRTTESIGGSDVIAMFTVAPGACSLTLSGQLDMTAQVEVPKTGGDLRCIVRGGRLSCT